MSERTDLISTVVPASPWSSFKAPWWLPNGHAQTLWRKLAPLRAVTQRRQRVELNDGDFIDLDWVDARGSRDDSAVTSSGKPLVFVLHGLGGCSRSPYVQALQSVLQSAGYDSVAMNLRGCSGEPNRLAKSYHSGCSEDVEAVLEHLPAACSERQLVFVGYSLGANVLLKWLAETPQRPRVQAAVAVSSPFSLASCCREMNTGWPRVYGRYFLRRLSSEVEVKKDWFRRHGNTEQLEILQSLREPRSLRSLWEFDEYVTAPLHGFAGAQDYYDRCSSDQFLPQITTPTLIVHGLNDPICPSSVLPDMAAGPDNIHWAIYDEGGHVGFSASGQMSWLEQRILHHIELT